MKKIILFLMVLIMTIAGASGMTSPTITSIASKHVMNAYESVPFSEAEMEPIEQNCFIEDIPLTCEEQNWLQSACNEFNVPYALVLGLIEKETTFQNIAGDNGASTGYMQIQKKWHQDRMERLGVTDLLEPNGNFRVGCDFLSELYERYKDWSLALTVYNMGHNPGYVTDYAKKVMGNYARWQELVETYD